MGCAVKEYFEACSDVKDVKEKWQEKWPDLEIGLVHAFYARMGGFAVDMTEVPGATKLSPREALPVPKTPGDEASDAVTSMMISGPDPPEDSPTHGRASAAAQTSDPDLEKLSSSPSASLAPRDLRLLDLSHYSRCHLFSNLSLLGLFESGQFP